MGSLNHQGYQHLFKITIPYYKHQRFEARSHKARWARWCRQREGCWGVVGCVARSEEPQYCPAQNKRLGKMYLMKPTHLPYLGCKSVRRGHLSGKVCQQAAHSPLFGTGNI